MWMDVWMYGFSIAYMYWRPVHFHLNPFCSCLLACYSLLELAQRTTVHVPYGMMVPLGIVISLSEEKRP